MAEKDNITLSSHLPLILSTVVIVLTVFGGFWSLADPRTEIRDIRTSYLSLREHEEFVNRFNKDIARLESENIEQSHQFQTLLNARQSKEAADQATLRLEQRIDQLGLDLRALQKSTISQEQFNVHITDLQERLKQLDAQVETLHNQFHMHVETDTDRFLHQQNADRLLHQDKP